MYVINLRRGRRKDPTVTADGTMCDEHKVKWNFTCFCIGCMDVPVCICERERERESLVFKFVINGTNFGYYIIVVPKILLSIG